MNEVKISQLPVRQDVDGSEKIPAVSGNENFAINTDSLIQMMIEPYVIGDRLYIAPIFGTIKDGDECILYRKIRRNLTTKDNDDLYKPYDGYIAPFVKFSGGGKTRDKIRCNLTATTFPTNRTKTVYLVDGVKEKYYSNFGSVDRKERIVSFRNGRKSKKLKADLAGNIQIKLGVAVVRDNRVISNIAKFRVVFTNMLYSSSTYLDYLLDFHNSETDIMEEISKLHI